jgi:hypothetical protein
MSEWIIEKPFDFDFLDHVALPRCSRRSSAWGDVAADSSDDAEQARHGRSSRRPLK